MTNVLLLMSDEHNPLYSSPYGHPTIRTPHMERLAERGTVFANAYCTSPLCMPSRSSFMTGRYVHEIQVYNNCTANLGYTLPTYGRMLAAEGVHSTHVGKVHAYAREETLGFAEMLVPSVWRYPTDPNISRQPLAIRPDGPERADRYGPHPNPFGEDVVRVETAIDWLRESAPELEAPWVLSVNLNAPHFPHYVTQDLWDLYPEGGDLPGHGRDCASAQHPYAQDLRRHFGTEGFTEEQVRGLRRGYLGGVTWVDAQLGRLLAALDDAGMAEGTDVLYAADHGEMLGKFGMWWKCTLYEDSVRVPLIAAGPSYGRGVRVRTPVSLLDAQASVFAATGARRPETWRGRPLQEIEPDDEGRVVFSEYHGHGTRAGAYMVRRGRWKYIHYVEAPHQLFDLAEDPDETENLAAARPDVVAELRLALGTICDPDLENRRAEGFIRGQLETLAAARARETPEGVV